MSSTLLWFLVACSTPQGPPVAPALRVGAPGTQTLTAIQAPVDLTDFGRSVASGDFNGDSLPELAIGAHAVDGSGVVTLWDVGGIAPVLVDTLPAAPHPAAPGAPVAAWGDDGATLVVMDLNDDAFDDLIAGDPRLSLAADEILPYGLFPRGRLVVRLGGPGGLGPAISVEGPQTGSHIGDALEALGDVDGDGFGDLVASHAGSWRLDTDVLLVAHGRADGGVDWDLVADLAPPANDHLGREVAPLGDVDGDGTDDFAWTWEHAVAGASPDPELRWAPGQPDVSLSASAPWGYSQLATTASLLDVTGPGDLNGDGAPDLVVGPNNATFEAAWFANTGGSFANAPSGVMRLESSDIPLVAAFGRSAGHLLAAGDVDGDGRSDLVAFATQPAELLIYRWSIGASGPATLATDVRGYNIADVGLPTITLPAGDLDHDGLADLVLSDGAGKVNIVWGDRPEGCAPRAAPTAWYLDHDGDGFASDGHARLACSPPPRASATPGLDCDDDDAGTHPGMTDQPAVDRDCDGQLPCFVDGDDDGWGGGPVVPFTGRSCDPRWSAVASRLGDCNDTYDFVNPDVSDRTDGDYNCDGVAPCYTDRDNDDYGTTPVDTFVVPGNLQACGAGLAPYPSDCDDADRSTHSIYTTWYTDGDGDGFGGPTVGGVGCHGPPFSAPSSDDCDDTNERVNPYAFEIPGGGDEDCRPLIACYEDRDGDGWGTTVVVDLPGTTYLTCDADPAGADEPTDCDDADVARHPGMPEDPTTPVDDNCNGVTSPTLQVRFAPPMEMVPTLLDGDVGRLSAVFVSLSGPGAGICPRTLGGECLDITSARLLGWDTTDANGEMSLHLPVPPQLSGTRIWLQAATTGAPGDVTPVARTRIP